MGYSNYPPGVSGNEPQIAGVELVSMERECEQCFYLGDVDVEVEHYGFTGYWLCPVCEKEHEEIDLFAPDPDEYYDTRFDREDY